MLINSSRCTEINITTDVGCDTICLKNLVKKTHHDQSLKVWSKTIQISLKKQFFVKTGRGFLSYIHQQVKDN